MIPPHHISSFCFSDVIFCTPNGSPLNINQDKIWTLTRQLLPLSWYIVDVWLSVHRCSVVDPSLGQPLDRWPHSWCCHTLVYRGVNCWLIGCKVSRSCGSEANPHHNHHCVTPPLQLVWGRLGLVFSKHGAVNYGQIYVLAFRWFVAQWLQTNVLVQSFSNWDVMNFNV